MSSHIEWKSGGEKLDLLTTKEEWFDIDGMGLKFTSLANDDAIDIVKKEIEEQYDFDKIGLDTDSIVIDIGGYIGVVSCYLAEKYGCKIYTYEPWPSNFTLLKKNVKDNGLENLITIHDIAVSGNGQSTRIVALPSGGNLGGASCVQQISGQSHIEYTGLDSITLKDIFDKYNIKKCDLLKIDCEGSEHDIIYKFPIDYFEKIKTMRGEVHINKYLTSEGYSIENFVDYCQHFVGKENVKFEYCKMAD
jgi:FkbM family methyltransferase